MAYPRKHGLYNPKYERDACGIGFVVNIKGEKSNQIVKMALESLVCLDHRGARGAEDNTGDGAGVLMQIRSVLQTYLQGNRHRPARTRSLRRRHDFHDR